MRTTRIVIMIILGISLLSGYACSLGSAPTMTPGATSSASAGPTYTPISTPKEPPQCEADRVAIQAAIDDYYEANGQWPTADGQPGLILWDKVVPGLMEEVPSTTECKWQVNSNPEGKVCQSAKC